MKNAKLFHGTGCTPDSYWFPYVKQNLERIGYIVSVPQLPKTDTPILKNWLPVALKLTPYDADTVLIGHSAGAPLILSVLESINVEIAKAILVAGYGRQRPSKKDKDTMIQESYDWDKIRSHVKDIYFINSVNDPWGCNDIEGRLLFDRLGGTFIINNEGHMGSDMYKQPYKEFPLLVKLLE